MEALGPAARKFVLHWGEMGTRGGVNRTVAQIHALLYISPELKRLVGLGQKVRKLLRFKTR